MALGGSCEFIMHCDRTVAALESYIGLVEAGVGLLPAGGGSKELAVRAAQECARGANGSQLDQFPFMRTYFQQVATATVSKSALDAKDLGYLRPSDVVIFNPYELLWVAKAQVRGARRERLPAAAAREKHPGRGQDRHRDAGNDVGQHARRRIRLRRTTSRSDLRSRASFAAATSTRAAWSTKNGFSRWSGASSCACSETRRRRSASPTRSRPASRCGTEVKLTRS